MVRPGRTLPPVSIHAPREGCDSLAIKAIAMPAEFQFTHPGRGATQRLASLINANGVSIHAPREGCDPRRR